MSTSEEEEDARERRGRGEVEPVRGDKRRKTKMGPKMRIGLRRGRAKVNAKKTEKKKKKKKGEDVENGFTKSRVG